MTFATIRPRRNRWIAFVCAAVLTTAAFGLLQSGASASQVRAAAGPSLSHVVISPAQPTKGKGFKVSFKTAAGATYEVFESRGQSGNLLASGATKAGTITTKRLGKNLASGKYTLGVRVTKGGKAKTITKTLVIKK